jgi:uncharacterized membrane protein
MNILTFNLTKTRNITEIIISFLSIVTGIILICNSSYLIYVYHFSSKLFLLMVPMTELISVLVIGMFLIFSGSYLLLNHLNKTVFLKLTGLLIMLLPLNINLLDLIKQISWTNSLWTFIIFPFGLFLYLFIGQKKYGISEDNYKTLKSDKIKLTFIILTYILIDVLFYNWHY